MSNEGCKEKMDSVQLENMNKIKIYLQKFSSI